ncbi:hypothetical protein MC7420_833 [Coleofasciculus chthonoplastes PCC 7420]|uniref:Uncharacterized protein n=1 Tax=Coleofasciculus chthonoplastes PCC 7420 TaxID=118168 RepID=B4VT62_9CYAN|nr:hypothetical protein [Coleofasciculus chthonoplastes]EDX74959.1 hypothetical protein MC7420_833 [Coleofasciculus chthonoplastes PCC 7420]
MSQKPSDLSCWFLRVHQDGISLKVKRSIGEVAEFWKRDRYHGK